MTDKTVSVPRPALKEFRTALNALYLEVEPSIANDISGLGNAAIKEAESDLQDAVMFLRIVLTRKDVTTLNCLKPKIADWLKRKGYEGSLLREEQSKMNKPPLSVPAESRPTNAELWLRQNFPTNIRNGKQIVVMEFDGHDEKFDYFVYQDFNGKCWEMADILEAYAASSSLLPVGRQLEHSDSWWWEVIQAAIAQWGGPQRKHFDEAMARIKFVYDERLAGRD